eukprot:2016820-Rhodomonas_salina.1
MVGWTGRRESEPAPTQILVVWQGAQLEHQAVLTGRMAEQVTGPQVSQGVAAGSGESIWLHMDESQGQPWEK